MTFLVLSKVQGLLLGKWVAGRMLCQDRGAQRPRETPTRPCRCSVAKFVWLFATLWTAACQASLSFTISQSLLKFMSIKWCYLTISFSTVLFSFCLQSFPESGSFPMSWLFPSGGQNIRAWASPSVPPMNIQGWFPVGLTWFSLLAVQETLQQFSPAPQFESINSLMLSLLYSISHIHTWLLEETIALTIWTFVCKVMSL